MSHCNYLQSAHIPRMTSSIVILAKFMRNASFFIRRCPRMFEFAMVLTYVSSRIFGFELLKTFVALDLHSLCVFQVVYTQF